MGTENIWCDNFGSWFVPGGGFAALALFCKGKRKNLRITVEVANTI